MTSIDEEINRELVLAGRRGEIRRRDERKAATDAAVIYLTEVHRLSLPAIAERLGVTSRTVSRARAERRHELMLTARRPAPAEAAA